MPKIPRTPIADFPEWDMSTVKEGPKITWELDAPIHQAEFYEIVGMIKSCPGVWDAMRIPSASEEEADENIVSICRRFRGRLILSADAPEDIDMFATIHRATDIVAQRSCASLLHNFVEIEAS